MSLTGKVALITGGSKGMGKAMALKLAADGAKVAITYSSDTAAADELVTSLGVDKALAVKADAGEIRQLDDVVKQTADKFGQIDILVANAGIMPMKGVEITSEEDFDRVYNVNVKGPYFLAQKVIPYMSHGSSIIFMSTTLCAASTVNGPYTLYVSSKGAVEQMTRCMSKDLAAKGINVNCVAPGPVGTELFLRGKPDSVIKQIASFNPHGRLGKPEEIAEAVAYLAGPGGSWVAGQIMRVNGGMA